MEITLNGQHVETLTLTADNNDLLHQFALKNVDVFIAPSKYIQEAAKADVSPIVHIPNFIELRPFQNFQQN